MSAPLLAAVLYEFDGGGAILYTNEGNLVLSIPQERHLYQPWPEVRVIYSDGTPASVVISGDVMDEAERVGLPRRFQDWPTEIHSVLHGGLVYDFAGFFVPEHMTWFVFGKPEDRLALKPPPQ